MWRAAVAAAQPSVCLADHWPNPPTGRLAVIACGKAAAGMADAAARHYRGHCEGIVILPDYAKAATHAEGFRYLTASHPVPDERSVAAAQAALELAGALGPDDLLLVLLSGGGSSLMCLPATGLGLEQKQTLSRQLLSCGATIGEINCVRKHLSRIKGGRLARACPGPVVTLAISDVPGDDPGLIASGPTIADTSTPGDALAVLARHGIEAAPEVSALLRAGDAGLPPAKESRFRIVASAQTAMQTAARWCRERGIEPIILGDDLQGDARQLAREHGRKALALACNHKRTCLLSGGETTVRLCGQPGRGGRNTEYALALAVALRGHPRIHALAADTDGIDGAGGHSGGVVDPQTLSRARQARIDAKDFLDRHDSAAFFEAVGGLLVDGPTGTNVNDFRAILVCP
jgi:hydroxypyruvate reductase